MSGPVVRDAGHEAAGFTVGPRLRLLTMRPREQGREPRRRHGQGGRNPGLRFAPSGLQAGTSTTWSLPAMRANDGSRTAAEVLVDQLVIHGARQVFCVPGESYIAALDAMVERPVEVTVCRQESGACMMAEAVGKLTGRPGICFVTRGPGATNASAGLHIAQQDSTPLIL